MRTAFLSILAVVAAMTAVAQNPLDGSNPGLQTLPAPLSRGVGPVSNFTPSTPSPYWGSNNSYRYRRPVSASDFRQLLSAVNAQTFASNQLPMIQAAGLCGWFTCAQCAALMQIFDFDDNKLQVVQYLAAHLVDPFYPQPIMNQLTFQSSKRSAWNIIASMHR